MRDRPIIFSPAMVRAILADRKTQTRRIIKTQPDDRGLWPRGSPPNGNECNLGAPGDRLWVRETWLGPVLCATEQGGLYERYFYRATDEQPMNHEGKLIPWRSPIHMPHVTSRLTLEITEVRVQRLQGISDDDVFAEGIQQIVNDGQTGDDGSVRGAFCSLWNSIHGADAWAANPWVWALSFTVLRSI